ncbi:TauD/TfdA family dioxygenase [Streptomyces sp. NPDC048215]|uniref:TauD/TfdA family dioxygenase n=1 Tax=Streptomyces TaxID=1883 RepID=UPI002E1027D6|nr:TauD/TfdA family dioxygenase [[Kitasatospora] papulosa]WSK27608.1 TauD/TfdA family dioxygenase [[Kitasatospora] papulosa]
MSYQGNWKPLDINPDDAGVDPTPSGLAAFVSNINEISSLLIREKALVFRGFNVTEDALDPAMSLLLSNRLAYVHGNSPRSKVGSNLYTSTEYPSEFTISMHNELSYAHTWPSRLLFFAAQEPTTGGATPVVDGVTWLESLDPKIRGAFAGGLRYTQNLHDGFGFGKSWQDTFETDDRNEVVAFLNDSNAKWEWQEDGTLRVTQMRPATVRHPVTDVEVWFNQADQWHPAALGDETATELGQLLSEEQLPQSVRFADGSPIPDEYIIEVRDKGLEASIDVDWRTGDLMLIDNVLVGHGRRPFTGPRRVLVAMSD